MQDDYERLKSHDAHLQEELAELRKRGDTKRDWAFVTGIFVADGWWSWLQMRLDSVSGWLIYLEYLAIWFLPCAVVMLLVIMPAEFAERGKGVEDKGNKFKWTLWVIFMAVFPYLFFSGVK